MRSSTSCNTVTGRSKTQSRLPNISARDRADLTRNMADQFNINLDPANLAPKTPEAGFQATAAYLLANPPLRILLKPQGIPTLWRAWVSSNRPCRETAKTRTPKQPRHARTPTLRLNGVGLSRTAAAQDPTKRAATLPKDVSTAPGTSAPRGTEITRLSASTAFPALFGKRRYPINSIYHMNQINMMVPKTRRLGLRITWQRYISIMALATQPCSSFNCNSKILRGHG